MTDLYSKLKALQAEYGYSEFFNTIKKISKERLQNDNRPARIKFSWSKYRRLYTQQNGICSWCDDTMPLIRGQIEIDHINPNASNFNDDSNLQVLHKHCNREKSSKSIQEVSKETGKTFVEQLP